jgi:hypothetical protein
LSLKLDCGVHDFVDSKSTLDDEKLKPMTWVDGGPFTDQNQFPFIVALIYRKSNQSATHFCGNVK